MALWINNINKSTQLFIPRSSPDGPWINNHPSSRSSPKALEYPFITILQDQGPKALEDPFITVIQDQASTALEETLILKIKPQRLLEDPLKSTFKDQAHGPLKKLPTVHLRSSLDGPWINETSTNQYLTEIESEDQNRERL
ncbi:hypothetical protein TB2_021785 [Malus domestica]